MNDKVNETGVISGPKDCKADTIWQGKTINGENLGTPFKNLTLDDCKKRCQEYGMDEDGNYCDFYHFTPDSVKLNECQLKGITTAESDHQEKIIFGTRYCPPQGSGLCKILTMDMIGKMLFLSNISGLQPERNMPGVNIVDGKGNLQTTADLCFESCQFNPRCDRWAWFPENNECWLKSLITELVDDPTKGAHPWKTQCCTRMVLPEEAKVFFAREVHQWQFTPDCAESLQSYHLPRPLRTDPELQSLHLC